MNKQMYRLGLLALVLAFLAAPVVRGQEDEPREGKTMAVKLKDGRTFRGTIHKRDDGIEVKTIGGVLIFQESEIESIQPVVSAKDAYTTKRSETDLNSAKSLYELAKWVWEEHQDDRVLLQHARTDLYAALKIDKNYTRAKLLLRQVEAKIKILKVSTAAPAPGGGDTLVVEDRDLVNQDDIYWIRLQELRPTDRVKIQYKNKVLKRYVDDMRGRTVDGWDLHGKEKNFLGQPRHVQVMEILRNKPNDLQLLQDIQVMADPKFMTEFKSQVWPIIQNNCAKANCHGGPTANGRLKFFIIPGANAKADYTNFLVVSGWRKGKYRLLDRQDIEASLLLQYGLNTKVAQKKHPIDIPPVFTGIRARNYRRVYNWMASLKKPIAPNYHIHPGFKPAGMSLDTTGVPIMSEEVETKAKTDE